MISPKKSIFIDSPNKTLFDEKSNKGIPFGEFIDPIQNEVQYEASVANVKAKDMYLPNLAFRTTEGCFSKDAVLINESGQGPELLGSCLLLKGNMRSYLKKQNSFVEAFTRSQNFKYDPQNDYQHVIPSEGSFHLLHVSYNKEFLYEFLPENEAWAVGLRDRLEKNQRVLGEKPSIINQLQERALHNIFNCPLQGKLGQMMVETSVVQVILLQLNSLFDRRSGQFPSGIAKRDVDTINNMKEHLTLTFLEDHSLRSLARHFGMNTNKLMVLFKKVFNKSIFEYISELRMEHAMQLLRDEKLQVLEVSRTIGFKNANHFSTAFKKKYGFKPSELK